MRNKSFATLGVLALLAAASAFGQHRLTADIPFEFHVGTRVMPAGQYDMRPIFGNNESAWLISCYECGATTGAQPYRAGEAHIEGRLIFHKYGGTYFLSEWWSSDSGVRFALPESKVEREIARKGLLARTSQTVLARR
jgi:hypothetical protein